jgi:Uncharacterised protein family (UPF0158)
MESGTEPQVARRLRCDLTELVDAFDDASWEMSVYLDLDTGEVIHITADVREELEAIYAELPEEPTDGEAYEAAFASAIERRKLPAWMHDLLKEADAVESGLGTRFLCLPQRDSHESYMDMQAFIETVAHPRLEERLWAAIRGRGAFGRFKDVLAGCSDECERWFAFKAARVRQRVLAWLADEGIELVEVIR